MADPQLLQTVNEIAGDLDQGERKSMLYLCGHPVPDGKGECLPEFLKSRITRGQMDQQFLAELLFAVKRFDILRKFKKVFESDLGNRQMLSRYRVLMVNINEDMTNRDTKNLLFLLSRTVPREKIDNLEYFLDVVLELEKLDKLSPERLDFMEKCLRNIDRIDLAKKVCSYKKSDEADQSKHSVAHLEDQQHCTTTHCPSQSYSYPLQQLNHQQHINNDPQISTPVSTTPISQKSLMEYSLQAKPRGLCLIIDCVGTDGERMQHAFRSLHFKVELHKLLSLEDTVRHLEEMSGRRAEHRSAEAFVCCIISRGTDNKLLATDAPSSNRGLSLDVVRHLFGGSLCPMLAGKPKLFFIQRYGVSTPPPSPGAAGPGPLVPFMDSNVEADGVGGSMVGSRLVPTDADVLWSHCWTDEHQLQQRNHCSVYLTALTAGLLKGQTRKYSLLEVHTELNGLVFDHNKRNPAARYNIDLKHTLRRRLCLT